MRGMSVAPEHVKEANDMGKTSEELGAHDETFIGSSHGAQRRRWSEKLGVSAAELEEAINAVGACPEDVERYLRDRARSSRSA
jgi:hypothetical protein